MGLWQNGSPLLCRRKAAELHEELLDDSVTKLYEQGTSTHFFLTDRECQDQLYLFIYFLATLVVLQDLSFLTRYQTQGPRVSTKSQPMDH